MEIDAVTKGKPWKGGKPKGASKGKPADEGKGKGGGSWGGKSALPQSHLEEGEA